MRAMVAHGSAGRRAYFESRPTAHTGTDPSDATLEVLALQQRVQEPLTPDERRHAVQVANGGPLQALESQVARLAAAWAPAQGV